jgi:hypothetical protein
MNVDAAIGEHAGISVNPANPGDCSNNSFQTLPSDSGRHSFWISPF